MVKKINSLARLDITLIDPGPIGDADLRATMTLTNGFGVPYDPAQLCAAQNIKISIGGNNTATQPQKPYNVKPQKSDWSDDQAIAVLGMPATKDFRLLANYLDDTHGFRNGIVLEQWGQDLLPHTPHLAWVEVYIGGALQGLYQMAQRVKRGSAITVAKLGAGASDQTLPNLSGGYIVEIDNYTPGEGDVAFNTDHFNVHYKMTYPKGADITPAQLAYIKAELNGMELGFLSDDVSKINVPSLARYHLIQEIPKNFDAYVGSNYFHKERGELIEAGPLWDFDAAFSTPLISTDPALIPPEGVYIGARGWYDRLRHVPAFQAELRSAFLDNLQNFHNAIPYVRDGYAFLKSTGAFARNFALWTDWAGQPVTEQSLDARVAYLIDWVSKRLYWMKNYYAPRTLNAAQNA